MADSWINYKLYNVKRKGNNDSIISLPVLRISHFRGRCKSVRRTEKTRSGRSEWAQEAQAARFNTFPLYFLRLPRGLKV